MDEKMNNPKMNNPNIEIGFPLSNDTEFITRDVWKELSRELEDKYPAVHLWLYRLYRIRSKDKDGGQIICLRVGGIEAFREAKYELLFARDYTQKSIIDAAPKCKTYLTLVPTLRSVIIPIKHFFSYYDELRELDPLVAENLVYLLYNGKVQTSSFYAFDLYEGWDMIFSSAIKALKDYTILSLTSQEDDSYRPPLKELGLPNPEKLTKDQEKLIKTFNLFLKNPIEFYIKAQEALDEYRRVFNQYQLASEELRLRDKA